MCANMLVHLKPCLRDFFFLQNTLVKVPLHFQSWVFTGGTDVEAETPILWPPDTESWLIWKDPDAGKDWGQEEKGMTEGEMVGWHHRHNGHGFGWTPGVGDGQGDLVWCGSWGHKESDRTERLNWTEVFFSLSHRGWKGSLGKQMGWLKGSQSELAS